MICRRTFQFAALSCLLLVLSTSAFADPTLDARKAITMIYQQRAAAMGHKNANGAFRHLAPGYVREDHYGHKTTMADQSQSLIKVINLAKEIHDTVSITRFSLEDKSVLATVNDHLVVLLIHPRIHKLVNFEELIVSKDTWIRAKLGWQEKSSKIISDKMMIDGLPLPD
jgi:hypothetical protein